MVHSVQGGTADGDGATKLDDRGVNDGGNARHSLGTAANAPPGASCALADRGRTPILNDADGSTATPADHDASGNATRTQATPLKPDAIWDHPSELCPKSTTPCGPDDAGDTLICPDQQGAADPGAPTGKTSRASRRLGNKDPGVVSAPNWTDPATPTAINDHGSGGTPPLLVKDNGKKKKKNRKTEKMRKKMTFSPFFIFRSV
ncbi:hypothetical protein BC940DRAFT_169564 [Gongronella butleri]|nr:hypothetical protein BC940DRAFT_169564 [Gongronella butleri]